MARGAGSRRKRKATRSRTTAQTLVSKPEVLEQLGMTDVTSFGETEPSAERQLLEFVRSSFETGLEPDPVPVAVYRLTFSEEAQQAAVAALLAGVELEGSAPEPLETFRVRLEQFVTEFQEEFDAVALPDEHQPGEALPARAPTPAAPEVTPPASIGGQLRWRAALVPEGKLTDDGRAFAPDSITWRELPLTLMAMIETTEGGHVGAQVAGRIDRIWRDADGMLRGEGVFDEGDYGAMIGGLVGDRTLRGVSVDVAVHSYEVGPRSDWFDEDGGWAPKAEEEADERSLSDLLFDEGDEPVIFVVTEGVIGAATVCPFQAFADATIELAASLTAGAHPALWTVTQDGGMVVTLHAKVGGPHDGEMVGIEVEPGETAALEGDHLTAAAAGLAPVAPPAEWFDDPELQELTPLVVTPEGRVYGHAAAWDTCHIGIPDVCTVAPHSDAGYAYFLLKEVECDDGTRVTCGTITLETGHADRGLGRAQAAAHYDDTGMAAVDVVVGEDAYGIWVAGAVRPDMDAEKVRALRGAVLSGDWRNVNGNLELVALLAVNVPGFPVPRTRALVASGEDGNVRLTLIAAGVHNGPVEGGEFVSPEARAKLEALRDVAAGRFADLAARARSSR